MPECSALEKAVQREIKLLSYYLVWSFAVRWSTRVIPFGIVVLVLLVLFGR